MSFMTVISLDRIIRWAYYGNQLASDAGTDSTTLLVLQLTQETFHSVDRALIHVVIVHKPILIIIKMGYQVVILLKKVP